MSGGTAMPPLMAAEARGTAALPARGAAPA
jgi:hypothetical protein